MRAGRGEWSLTNRVTASAAVSISGLVTVFAFVAISVANLRSQIDQRRSAQQIRVAADRLQTSVLDLETGLRAFIITREERLLEPWEAARTRLPAEQERLQAALAGSGAQLEGLGRSIRAGIDRYYSDYSLPMVRRARRENMTTATVRQDLLAGKRKVDTLRIGFRQLFGAQARILAAEERDADEAVGDALRVAVIGLALLIAAAVGQVLYVRRAVTGPVSQVAAAAGALASGRPAAETPVTDLLRHPTREIRSLTEAFDLMAASIRRNTERLERRVRERTAELEQSQREALLMLAGAAEFRDDDTHRHTQRVGRNAAMLGEQLGLGPETVELLRNAAPLHDVGKIGISDAILLKPGRLTPEEFDTIKEHTTIGFSILSSSSEPVFHIAAQIAYTHHERWDGTGYPEGIAGTAIPLAGRIVAVVDVFDALTQERPYKEAWPLQEAVDEIRRGAGSHFDPDVVRAFDALPAATLIADEASQRSA